MAQPSVPELLPAVGPAGAEAREAAWQLLGELHEMRAARFLWVHSIRQKLLDDYISFRRRFQDWRQKVDTRISALKERDESAGTWLAAMLAVDPRVFDPGCLNIYSPTGYGEEAFTFVGTGWRTEQADSAVGGSYHHSIANPIELHFDARAFRRSMTLSEVARQKLWILWTKPAFGRPAFAFCVDCPCHKLVTKSQFLDDHNPGSFHSVPRQFHSDPLLADNALRHFETTHYEVFANGVPDLLQKYGIAVKSDGNQPLDRWAIVANNFAVQQWHDEAVTEWENLRREHRPNVHRRPKSRPQPQNRIIPADQVSGQFAFSWPDLDSARWVVVCPYPDCALPFRGNPMQEGRAIEHFRLHGIHIEGEGDLLNLFGFQIIEEDGCDGCPEVPCSLPVIVEEVESGYTSPPCMRLSRISTVEIPHVGVPVSETVTTTDGRDLDKAIQAHEDGPTDPAKHVNIEGGLHAVKDRIAAADDVYPDNRSESHVDCSDAMAMDPGEGPVKDDSSLSAAAGGNTAETRIPDELHTRAQEPSLSSTKTVQPSTAEVEAVSPSNGKLPRNRERSMSADTNAACLKCHGTSDPDVMLLCDRCNHGYHTYCIGLRDIPGGRWFCGKCRPSVKTGDDGPRHTLRPRSTLNSPISPFINAGTSTPENKRRTAHEKHQVRRQNKRTSSLPPRPIERPPPKLLRTRASATPDIELRRRTKTGQFAAIAKRLEPGYKERLREKVRLLCEQFERPGLQQEAEKRRIPVHHKSRMQLATRIIQFDEDTDELQEDVGSQVMSRAGGHHGQIHG